VTVITAVPTLFGPDGSIDLAANRALYVHVNGLLDGLLVAGTTGEFPSLDDSERLALISLALEVAGPSRVIAHIGAPSAYQATRLARAAVSAGATRLAAITPYYLPVRAADLAPYYAAVREAAPSVTLYAYIFPERTGVHVPAPLFATVASVARLAGAKLSGSASGLVSSYAACSPDLEFYCGDDSAPARSVAAGAAGVVSGRSAAYPEVYASGDQDRIDEIVGLGSSVGRIKYAVSLRGFGSATARMPVDPPDEATAAAIAGVVRGSAALRGLG
jgi:4-hydroxy-tetrahydrodipicolinate synthase